MKPPAVNTIIRTDGRIEALPPMPEGPALRLAAIYAAIGCDTIDQVVLRAQFGPDTTITMVVDDIGLIRADRPPVNTIATELYRANCHPGTQHVIVGDVAIVDDNDFGGGEDFA